MQGAGPAKAWWHGRGSRSAHALPPKTGSQKCCLASFCAASGSPPIHPSKHASCSLPCAPPVVATGICGPIIHIGDVKAARDSWLVLAALPGTEAGLAAHIFPPGSQVGAAPFAVVVLQGWGPTCRVAMAGGVAGGTQPVGRQASGRQLAPLSLPSPPAACGAPPPFSYGCRPDHAASRACPLARRRRCCCWERMSCARRRGAVAARASVQRGRHSSCRGARGSASKQSRRERRSRSSTRRPACRGAGSQNGSASRRTSSSSAAVAVRAWKRSFSWAMPRQKRRRGAPRT